MLGHNVLSDKGKKILLEQLEEYRKLGTPEEIVNCMGDAIKKAVSYNFNILDKAYSEMERKLNETKKMFVEFQALIFIIIKDKLTLEGKITDSITEKEQMDLIKKDFNEHYYDMDVSFMYDLMVKYIKGDLEEETKCQ